MSVRFCFRALDNRQDEAKATCHLTLGVVPLPRYARLHARALRTLY